MHAGEGRPRTKKFDETVDVAINLGVDPKHADQMVRGAVVLPHGIGKAVRVAVFAKGDKAKEAEAAGADIVGAEDLAAKVAGRLPGLRRRPIATPDMMGLVGRLGKVLGPRGLMPNPKLGTVTTDVAKAVREIEGRQGGVPRREGRHRPRAGRQGVVHRRRSSRDNLNTLLESVMKAKPPTAKGIYLQGVVGLHDDGPRHQDRHAWPSRRDAQVTADQRLAERPLRSRLRDFAVRGVPNRHPGPRQQVDDATATVRLVRTRKR